MQDRVAEVLLERESLGQLNPAGLLISITFHALVFFFLIFSPHRTATTIERPRVITMRLAGPQQAAQPAGADRRTPAAVSPPAARPLATPAPVIAPPEPPAAKPVRTDPARTGAQSVFGTAGKPAPARTSTPSPAPPASGGAPGTSPPSSPGSGTFEMPGVGSAGVTGIEGGDFPYDVYIDRMTTRIGGNWFRPGGAGEMITRVHFIIERDGRIRDAKIDAASGNRTFDRAALRAVIESSPLPPLPGQYSGRYLGVYLTFH
ncbi:MAG TPA: TonB family protein [Thermoanaerobaculia bacterium]|nr:TonB family protein [Thermoanaerobaculia bacterium]